MKTKRFSENWRLGFRFCKSFCRSGDNVAALLISIGFWYRQRIKYSSQIQSNVHVMEFLLKHNFIRFRFHSTCMSIKNLSSATEHFCSILKKNISEREREREQFNLCKEWIAHQCYVYLYEILSYFTCMRIRWKYTDVSRYIFLQTYVEERW